MQLATTTLCPTSRPLIPAYMFMQLLVKMLNTLMYREYTQETSIRPTREEGYTVRPIEVRAWERVVRLEAGMGRG